MIRSSKLISKNRYSYLINQSRLLSKEAGNGTPQNLSSQPSAQSGSKGGSPLLSSVIIMTVPLLSYSYFSIKSELNEPNKEKSNLETRIEPVLAPFKSLLKQTLFKKEFSKQGDLVKKESVSSLEAPEQKPISTPNSDIEKIIEQPADVSIPNPNSNPNDVSQFDTEALREFLNFAKIRLADYDQSKNVKNSSLLERNTTSTTPLKEESKDKLTQPATTNMQSPSQKIVSEKVNLKPLHVEPAEPNLESKSIPEVSSELAARRVSTDVLSESLSEMTRQSVALRHQLENSLLNDINELDEHALRARVTQLAAELFDRLTWEGVRISHSVKLVENELTEKYENLLSKQRAELEFEVKKILFDRERELSEKSDSISKELAEKYSNQLNQAIRAQAEGFNNILKKELESQQHKLQYEHEVEINKIIYDNMDLTMEQTKKIESEVSELSSKLSGILKVYEDTSDAIQKTIGAHDMSSSVLTLEFFLSNSFSRDIPIKSQINKIRKVCQNDQLVTSILDSIPSNVFENGALTLSELQVRFQVMKNEVRKAALAPENAPSFLGQLVGNTLAFISRSPKGYVPGPGVEEALARAEYYLERGNIKGSLKELDGIEGYAKLLMKDWKSDALDRILVDQSIKVLKANSILRHKSLFSSH